ncbi:MAG: hypothetical protein KF883_12515 [Thermomicrobiales bacterium]|nr:hypothetical protein [Thermomicrobiales bacterium]
MNTFNLYMDEVPPDLGEGQESFSDVLFRLVPSFEDAADPDDAVLAGLDIYDLLDLRNAIQEVIDIFATASLDPAFVEQLEEDAAE